MLCGSNPAQNQANYNYREQVKRMLDMEQQRLIVNLDDLRDYDRSYADGLLLQPTAFLPALEGAVKQMVQALHEPAKHNITDKDCKLLLTRN